MFMCNIIDFFFYYIESQTECWTSNFQIISSLYGLLFFKFNGISQWNEQSKEVISVLSSFQFQILYVFLVISIYSCTKVSIYK